MKTMIKSLMVVTMMTLGTVTSMGKTTTNVNNHNNHATEAHGPKKECLLRHIHNEHCGGPVVQHNVCNLRHIHDAKCQGVRPVDRRVVPGLDDKTRKHIIKGNHKFDRHGVCVKCNLDKHQIRQVKRRMGIR